PEDRDGRTIYPILAGHQQAESWTYRELMEECHRWIGIFDDAFALRVPEISLGVDRLRSTCFGHFRRGHNAFGLKGEIVLNERHLRRPGWQILGTLLHEMLHGWQQAHGRPGRRNHHNKEFRAKAESLGLLVDQRGYTSYLPDSPFTRLLA